MIPASFDFLNLVQHGFINRRNTTTNLLDYYHYFHDNLDKDVQTDVIYLNFSKEFEFVPLMLLFKKLEMLGYSGSLLSWILRN